MKKEFIEVIKDSWSNETTYPGSNWTKENPALGQCAITALVINDFMGGKIMRCIVENGSHYYNLIEGKIFDLTASQFNVKIDYSTCEERTREYLLSNKNTKERYLLLLNNIKQNCIDKNIQFKLIDKNGKEYMSNMPGTLGGNKKLKIYGKLDCYSALNFIKKGYYVDKRVFFKDEETAISAGYRPCAKCMRKEYQLYKEKIGKKEEK